MNVVLRLFGSCISTWWPSLRLIRYPVRAEPPVSAGADQATVTLEPDDVADTASGAAGTDVGFDFSADIAWSRAVYRAVRALSVAASSATVVFASPSALLNAFHDASV